MKVAIVTGAAGGIGFATVCELVKKGFVVVGMNRRPYESVKGQFEPLGDSFVYVSGDLSSSNDRKKLVDTAIEKFGRIDALVNVAGVAPKERRDILEMTEESYDYVMGINSKGTFFLTQDVANRMVERKIKGYIVNISSVSAYTSSTSRGEYCISKAGVSMMTRLFADRLATEGILVNEVCPGIIYTEMTEKVKDKYDAKIADGLVPTGRWGYPDDVAKAVGALVDGTFAYTTGESFIVDGGLHIRKL